MGQRSGFGRRTFLIGGAAFGTALIGSPGTAAATPGRVSQRVGALEVITLLDAEGEFPLPAPETFPTATEADWAAARLVDPGAFGPNDRWHLNFQVFLIRRPGGRFTLVDTGIGPADGPASGWAPVPGHLPERLAAAGIDVRDVDTVVLTHLHEDHYGWAVSPAGVPMFPDARYVVQRTEVDGLRAGDVARTYKVEPLRSTGQLHQVDGRVKLAGDDHRCREWVGVVPTPGHTVGHQSVLVEGRRKQIVITGDVLVHAVQLVNPEVAYRLERDKPTAARTRRELLDSARRKPTVLATAHLNRPFVTPG